MPCVEENIAPLQLCPDGVTAPHCERVAVGVEKLTMKPLESVADADDDIDGAANSAVTIAGPRHGTMSSRTFGARAAIFSIRGGTSSSTARSGIIRRKRRSLLSGVEIVRNEEPSHLIERLRQRSAQRLGAGRQFHAGADAHQ